MHCYSLTKARPDLLITVFEASVSPGGGCSLGGQLMRLNALNLRKLKHMGAPDMNNSKTLVTSNTREVFAGMICGGMELAELDGLPRMDASSTASCNRVPPRTLYSRHFHRSSTKHTASATMAARLQQIKQFDKEHTLPSSPSPSLLRLTVLRTTNYASPVLHAYFFLRQLKTKGAEDDIQWYVSEF
ncbi:unnamed protein product [Tilletia caries]|nr:unnamed protein product [Tilletia caries]